MSVINESVIIEGCGNFSEDICFVQIICLFSEIDCRTFSSAGSILTGLKTYLCTHVTDLRTGSPSLCVVWLLVYLVLFRAMCVRNKT